MKQINSDKLRGGYYTPSEIAYWVSEWAITRKGCHVLEPSCGDGAFLSAAASRLLKLGGKENAISDQITGIELIDEECAKANKSVQSVLGLLFNKSVINADLFSWWSEDCVGQYDCVVGNPPFIRYQNFPENSRSLAMKLMENEGMKPNKLTNIWAPFVVASAMAVKKGGRLGLVVPAELLQVTYAAQVRDFLLRRFERVNVIACNELFFERAQQEVVILLAENPHLKKTRSRPCEVSFVSTKSKSEALLIPAKNLLENADLKQVQHNTEKWLKYFLTQMEIDLMRDLRESSNTSDFKDHGGVDVGVVTGKNQFFVIDNETVEEFDLSQFTVPLVSRTAQIAGLKVTRQDWVQLAAANAKVHLLDLNTLNPDQIKHKGLLKYLSNGKADEVHKGYKCSIRKNWYQVPSIWTPDAFLFRQIYDFPRMVLNNAKATATDTIHRVTCNVKPSLVVGNACNHLTAASAEIEGRSYGGGVLELEPTEAERLLFPKELKGCVGVQEADKLARSGRLGQVLEENDKLILQDNMCISKKDCKRIKSIWEKMRDRRTSRKSSKKLK